MKKVIISISLIMAVILVFTACKSAKYVDTPATIPVTDENGVAVTDKNGEVVTEVVTVAVTDENGKEVTDKDGKVVTEVVIVGDNTQPSDQSGSAENKTSNGASQNSGSNSGSAGGSDGSNNGSDKGTTTTKQTTTKKPTTTTKPTTTAKAKKRDVTITVNLPYYNGDTTELTLYYRVEGDKKDTKLETRTVVLNNKQKEIFKIEDVKGEVYAYIELEGISVASYSNSVTISAGDKEGSITPVTGIEIIDGGMV